MKKCNNKLQNERLTQFLIPEIKLKFLRRYLSISVILFSFFLSSQTTFQQKNTIYKTASISSKISFQLLDLFYLKSFDIEYKRLNYSVSLGAGINRTIYQKHFFPQIQFGLAYMAIEKQKFYLGPEINLSFSTVKVIDQHYFGCLGIGYFLRYGNKWFFSNRTNFGILNEKFKNSESKTVSASAFNYQFSIGFGYAL
jgi:hypothetical protein